MVLNDTCNTEFPMFVHGCSAWLQMMYPIHSLEMDFSPIGLPKYTRSLPHFSLVFLNFNSHFPFSNSTLLKMPLQIYFSNYSEVLDNLNGQKVLLLVLITTILPNPTKQRKMQVSICLFDLLTHLKKAEQLTSSDLYGCNEGFDLGRLLGLLKVTSKSPTPRE